MAEGGGGGDRKIALSLEEAGPSRKKRDEREEEVINYIKRVEARFQGDDRAFKWFVEIMRASVKKKKPKHQIMAEAKALFRDHRDLFVEFVLFGSYTPNLASVPSQIHADSIEQLHVDFEHQLHTDEEEQTSDSHGEHEHDQFKEKAKE